MDEDKENSKEEALVDDSNKISDCLNKKSSFNMSLDEYISWAKDLD